MCRSFPLFGLLMNERSAVPFRALLLSPYSHSCRKCPISKGSRRAARWAERACDNRSHAGCLIGTRRRDIDDFGGDGHKARMEVIGGFDQQYILLHRIDTDIREYVRLEGLGAVGIQNYVGVGPSMRMTADGPSVTRLGPKLCQPSKVVCMTVTRASMGAPPSGPDFPPKRRSITAPSPAA